MGVLRDDLHSCLDYHDWSFSMNFWTTSEHPRLIASIPTDPVPLYKSSHRPGLSEAGEPQADCKVWSWIKEGLWVNKRGTMIKVASTNRWIPVKCQRLLLGQLPSLDGHSYLWVKVISFCGLFHLAPERNIQTWVPKSSSFQNNHLQFLENHVNHKTSDVFFVWKVYAPNLTIKEWFQHINLFTSLDNKNVAPQIWRYRLLLDMHAYK